VSIDPALPFFIGDGSDNRRLTAAIIDHQRRLAVLERGNPVIQVISGAPTSSPREGAPIADKTAARLYLYLNGVWRYTTLT
jgi:hypothetical protein